MTMKTLPTKLDKEPLIEVLFECRFETNAEVVDILSSTIINDFQSPQITRLPNSEIPRVIRKNDINLKYAPIIRIDTTFFSYLIGENCYIISCNLPYTGWSNFRKAIQESIGYLIKIDKIDFVHRYSLKYVDLIDKCSDSKSIDVEINVGSNNIEADYNLGFTSRNSEFIQFIQIVSDVEVSVRNIGERKGTIVDIDTIKELGNLPISSFLNEINKNLDNLHQSSKELFFNLLTENGLNQLEPRYE